MELINPLAIEIGLPIIVMLVLILHIIKMKTKYSGGTKAANTRFLKDLPIYKKRRRVYFITTIIVEVCLVLSMAMSAFLVARPAEKHTTSNGTKKRDIFLCLDVSYSICDLNYDLVESLKEVVAGLDGDRFGISIYNTSTVLYVPMTDDYDFVVQKLDELKVYFDLQKQYMALYKESYHYNTYSDEYNQMMELQEKLDFYDAGTLVNNYVKGSSLVGEGLASCMYSFPRLESEDRTRLIIMSTDNAQEALASPLVELDEATDICKKNNIKVFGIFPNQDNWSFMNTSDYESDMQEFKKCVEKTGGTFYKQSETLTVDDIIKDIQAQEALEVDEVVMTRMVDQPLIPYLIILISLVMMAAVAIYMKV